MGQLPVITVHHIEALIIRIHPNILRPVCTIFFRKECKTSTFSKVWLKPRSFFFLVGSGLALINSHSQLIACSFNSIEVYVDCFQCNLRSIVPHLTAAARACTHLTSLQSPRIKANFGVKSQKFNFQIRFEWIFKFFKTGAKLCLHTTV